MKNRNLRITASWRLPAAVLAVFLLTAARADVQTWTGGGGDSLWTTPENWSGGAVPGAADTAVLTEAEGDIVLDAGFGGTISNLVLTAAFTNTLTLERPLVVKNVYAQTNGTFTAGANTVQVGQGATTAIGTFTLAGGVFNLPAGTNFYWRPHHTPAGSFVCTGGGLFNANGGTVDLQANWTTHTCVISNTVFQNLTLSGPYGALSFGANMTNTVLGDLRHTGVRVDKVVWLLHGDLEVSGTAGAGSGVARFISEEPQEIRFTPGAKAFGIAMDKPEGSTLTVVGGSCIFGGAAGAWGDTFGGLALLGGVFDASGVTNFTVITYNNVWTNAPEAVFKAPELVDIRGYLCRLHANGLVFSNLSFGVTDSRFTPQKNTTNTVAGDLKILYSGLADGTLAVKGDIHCLKTITGGYQAGGHGVVLANGELDQTLYAATNGAMPTLVVDKPAGTALRTEGNVLTFVAPGGGLAGGHLILAGGHFTLPASNLVFNSYGSQFVQKPGTTLDAVESTVSFTGWSPILAFTDAELHRVAINTPIASGMGGNNLSIAAGTTVTVARALVQTRGLLNAGTKGVVRLLGDLEIGERASGGSAPLIFAGGGEQLYNNQGTNVAGAVLVEKSGGVLRLESPMLWNRTTSQDATLRAGTVDLNGHPFAAGRTLTIEPGATLRFAGSEQAVAQNLVLTNGATLAFGIPAIVPGPAKGAGGPNEPLLVVSNKLTLPPEGTLYIEALPRIASTAPEKFNLIGYNTLAGTPGAFAWDIAMPPRQSPIGVFQETDEKLFYLSYRTLRGTTLLLR